MHQLDICDMPIRIQEGIKFEIFSGVDTPRRYEIYVPKGVSFKVID